MSDLASLFQRCLPYLTFEFIHAAGPGGQNVNKVATAVQMRFDVAGSPVLSTAHKLRLSRLSGRRLTGDGILVIEAKRYRTREQNREDAISRFEILLRKSFEEPKPRRKTRPSAAAREKRLGKKKKRGELKRDRQSRSFD